MAIGIRKNTPPSNVVRTKRGMNMIRAAPRPAGVQELDSQAVNAGRPQLEARPSDGA